MAPKRTWAEFTPEDLEAFAAVCARMAPLTRDTGEFTELSASRKFGRAPRLALPWARRLDTIELLTFLCSVFVQLSSRPGPHTVQWRNRALELVEELMQRTRGQAAVLKAALIHGDYRTALNTAAADYIVAAELKPLESPASPLPSRMPHRSSVRGRAPHGR